MAYDIPRPNRAARRRMMTSLRTACRRKMGSQININCVQRHFRRYLLHCWQKRCSWPPTITMGVLECASQTLWRLWYSLELLRSDVQPSTEHDAIWPALPGARALFDGPEDATAIDIVGWLPKLAGDLKSPEPPSLRSTEQSLPLLRLPRPPQDATKEAMWSSAFCSTSAKSREGSLGFHSMEATSLEHPSLLFCPTAQSQLLPSPTRHRDQLLWFLPLIELNRGQTGSHHEEQALKVKETRSKMERKMLGLRYHNFSNSSFDLIRWPERGRGRGRRREAEKTSRRFPKGKQQI